MIRSIRRDDLNDLERIYHKFYQNDMPFPDFLKHYLCAYVVTDKEERIVTIGGVRTIAESLILTDKDLPSNVRGRALLQMFDAHRFLAASNGYNNLNVFIGSEDKSWIDILKRKKFKEEKILTLEL